MMIADISRHRADLEAPCRRFNVRGLEIFGSAADLARFVDFKAALEALLTRRVDLIDPKVIESSRNYIRKRRILAGEEPAYAA